jgi:transcription elongation factor Elf1
LDISGELFVCPECGKQNLSIHRKTYEQILMVFCSSCNLNFSFEPSEAAYFDKNKSLEEFTANYRMVNEQPNKRLTKQFTIGWKK